MKKNKGLIDSTTLIILAVLILVLYLIGNLSGTAAIILGIFALIFILIGFIGICPLYFVNNLDQKKIKMVIKNEPIEPDIYIFSEKTSTSIGKI